MGQTAYSQAKFIIEHPDKAQDEAAVQLAGVEGVLRTWQAIKTLKPKAKFPLLDELLAKHGIACPRFADYAKNLLDFVDRHPKL